MRRKLAVYAFSLSAALAFMTGAVVVRYRAAVVARTAPEDPRLVPAGSLFASIAEVRFALLAPPAARGDAGGRASECLRRRAGVSAPMLAFGTATSREATPAAVRELPLAGASLAAVDELRGLGHAERLALRRVTEATVLVLRPRPPGLAAIAEGSRLVFDCAREHAALIADPATGEIFTAASWYAHRIESWSDGLPLVPSHLVVTATPSGDGAVALRTFGLVEFGLPELELPAARELASAATHVLEATAQAMLESGRLERRGVLELDVSRLRHAGARAALAAACGGAPPGAELVLRAMPADRDPAATPELGLGRLALAAVEPGVGAAVARRRIELRLADAPGAPGGRPASVTALCPAPVPVEPTAARGEELSTVAP